MENFIKYTDEFENEIDPLQISQCKIFVKQHFEDNDLKKSEYFKDGKLSSILYYINSLSDIDDILSFNPDASFKYKYSQSGYIVFFHLNYKKKALIEKTVYVRNNKDNTICYVNYNLPQDKPDYQSTDKYYYEADADDWKYYFQYSADGKCVVAYDEDEDYFAPLDGYGKKFNWDGLEYFKFAYPLIPENPLPKQT